MLKLFFNCTLYTGRGAEEKFDCLLAEEGKIKAVGRRKEIEPHLGERVEKIDLQGGVVTPGLVDAHTHFLKFSQQLLSFSFSDCSSLQEVLDKIKKGIKNTPRTGGWITGGGWDQNPWPEGWPHRRYLDEITGSLPAAFFSKDHHSLWVNTAALERAGISAATSDPAGGEIVRDEEGQPTGVLKENANDLVLDIIPPPSLAEAQKALKAGMEKASSLGLTGVHSFEGQPALQALQQLARREELILRFFLGIPQENLEAAIKIGLTFGLGNENLRLGHLKVFLDGALGSQTAAMIEPYENNPGERGIPTMEEKDFATMAEKAVGAGIPLAIHAIGDRVNRLAVEVLGNLREKSRKFSLRHRLEHAQLLTPQEITRIGRLNIIPSMQPVHLKGDQELIDRHWGKERGRWAFACKSLIENGAVLALGSDAPVESIDPVEGLYYSIFRCGENMQEALSPIEALQGYTLGPAYASGEEDRKGTLEKGKVADMTVFNSDFIEDPDEIKDSEVLATIVRGEFTYKS